MSVFRSDVTRSRSISPRRFDVPTDAGRSCWLGKGNHQAICCTLITKARWRSERGDVETTSTPSLTATRRMAWSPRPEMSYDPRSPRLRVRRTALPGRLCRNRIPTVRSPLDCPGYDCNLRISVVACLFVAWTATRKAAQRWVLARDWGLWCHCEAEADLRAWLQLPDATAFVTDLKVALLSVRNPDRRPHLTNASVAFQPSEIAALGYSTPTVVLHWILSPELLPLVGDDTPVCGADRAWRFGCVPPCLLGAATCDSADFPSDDCALFCTLLSVRVATASPPHPFGSFGRVASVLTFFLA